MHRTIESVARALASVPADSLDASVLLYLQHALESGGGDFEYVDLEALSPAGLEIADRMIEEMLTRTSSPPTPS